MSDSLLGALSDELTKLFQPLAIVVDNPVLLDSLLAQIGASAETAGGDQLLTSITKIVAVNQQIDQLSSQPSPSFAGIAALLEASNGAFQAIRDLGNASGPAAAVENFDRDLAGFLLSAYLFRWHPLAREIAALLTIVEPADTQDFPPVVLDANGNVVQQSFRVDRFHFDRISRLLSDPSGTLRAAYGNDLLTVADANAMADKLFPRLLAISRNLGITSRYGFASGDEALFGDAAPLVDHALIVYAADQALGADIEAGVVLTLSSADRGDLGLMVTPFGSLQMTTQTGAWKMELDFTADVQGFAYGRHGATILAGASTVEIDAVFTMTLPAPSDGPAFIVGAENGSRLEVGGAQLKASASLTEAQQSFSLSAEVSKSAIVIAPGDGDGFLKSVLPTNGVRAEFDLGLAWTNTGGLKVKGAGGLDVDVPAGLSLGGVATVDSIHVGIRADDSSVTLECSANAALNLGPMHVVVNRMGMLALLTFPDQGGNLGLLDGALSFKPPSGLGIAVDAGVVTGGGFLSFDPAKSEYRGAANLSVEGVGVSAFGLVQTQPEVSFLLLIATTFPVPIELGMGFSLEGVGGLAGIHRSLALDALETAVWKGTAKDILFPSTPIASAVSILNELDVLFPPSEGRYVFGPTVKITWGEPPLIVAQVGVIIELPDPVRIALVGNATAQFPPEKALVLLNVNFAGGIDFGTKRFFFDASLTGSRIESYPLSGDLSVRSSWSEPRNFALAVGGFNPHFQPPAGFPSLSRVALDISDGPLHLHLAAYLAITTNTFQVGAAVDLKASVCDCGIAGHFAFDALFSKNPFSFSVAIDASASITAAGETFASVHVQGTLAGPAPWHATGTASISLLFFSIGISFDRTWGSPPPAALPAVDPWTAALQPALMDPASWRGQLPAGVHPAVAFAPTAAGGVIYLDPAADVVLDQKAVPLNQQIDRFAERTLAIPVRFDVAQPVVNGTAVDASNWTLVSNEFAPSQFTEMSDDQKLSVESFVACPSGIFINPGAATGTSVQAGLTYDLIVIDSARAPAHPVPFLPLLVTQLASASTGPSARAPWRTAGLAAFAPSAGTAPKAALSARVFSIVSTANLAERAQAVASTRVQAAFALADFVEQQGAAAGSVQAVPQREVA